jgi:hypothetical protein
MKNPIWDAAVLDAKRLAARAQRCQAYQFADPFDNYNNASLLYEFVQGTPTFSSSYARFAPPSGLPGQGIALGANRYVRKNLLSNLGTVIIKAAVNFAGSILSSSGSPFLVGNDNGTAQWCIVAFPSGALAITLANGAFSGGTLGGTVEATTGPGVATLNGYMGVELKVTTGASGGGAISLWVNGTQVLNATGLTTQITSNAYVNQISLGDRANTISVLYADDFRIWDTTGSYQNAPLGTDSRLYTKLPNGAGGFAPGWTPNGAAANWQCVDDNPPDGDTTYVSSSTASNLDVYAVPAASPTQPPAMVVARVYARKDDSATRSLQVGAWNNSYGVGTYGGVVTLGSTYAFADGSVPIDPHTGAPWTAAAADAAQILLEEVS